MEVTINTNLHYMLSDMTPHPNTLLLPPRLNQFTSADHCLVKFLHNSPQFGKTIFRQRWHFQDLNILDCYISHWIITFLTLKKIIGTFGRQLGDIGRINFREDVYSYCVRIAASSKSPSALFTTTRWLRSIIPRFSPWSSSPPAGGIITTKRSTMSATANSDWPTPGTRKCF